MFSHKASHLFYEKRYITAHAGLCIEIQWSTAKRPFGGRLSNLHIVMGRAARGWPHGAHRAHWGTLGHTGSAKSGENLHFSLYPAQELTLIGQIGQEFDAFFALKNQLFLCCLNFDITFTISM